MYNVSDITYIDAHCHLYEYSTDYIGELVKDTLIFAVSDDLDSSNKTINISRKFNNVFPGVGIHPWVIDHDISFREALGAIDYFREHIDKIKMLGEIGLDSYFRRDTMDKQVVIFKELVKIAAENNLLVNVHALGTWRIVLEELYRNDVPIAILHWYSGPINMIEDIESLGYYITINPSVDFQRKHKEVLRKSPLSIILTESDGPYEYRGRKLGPSLIPWLIHIISSEKGIESVELIKVLKENVARIFRRLGVKYVL